MRSIGRISVLCLALALAMSVGLAADAAAKRSRVDSRATLQSVGPDGAAGQVSSSRRVCRAQRQVFLYRVNTEGSIYSSEYVTSTWTHGDGSWTIPGPLFPSEFFAVAQPKNTKRVDCQSATSNSLHWG
jgi:hypothetical protein